MTEYERLRAALDKKLAADPSLRAVVKRIKNGTATLADSAEYARVLSHILGREVSANVLDLDDREGVVTQLLRDCYEDVNSIYAQAQTLLDEQAGIHINPQKPAFPAERVDQFTHSLIDPTVKDSVIKRRAGAGTETITKSFHDDCIKKNAQFRYDAGLKCYIVRIGTQCCEWCSEVAGKYEFGDQPDGIFRRHDNCDCTIIYDGQVLRGKQNADGSRSKTWEELPNANAADYTPPTLSEAEGRAIEQRNLAQIRGLKINNSSIDNSNGNDIIESGEMFYTRDDPMREIMGSAYKNNREELFSIIDELESKGIEVDISESNSTMGYQPSPALAGGLPGRVKMHKEASLAAWEHERQHAIDDEQSGWNGRWILSFNPDEQYQWEVRAYNLEIEKALELGREDIAKRLEELLENERRAIYGIQ